MAAFETMEHICVGKGVGIVSHNVGIVRDDIDVPKLSKLFEGLRNVVVVPSKAKTTRERIGIEILAESTCLLTHQSPASLADDGYLDRKGKEERSRLEVLAEKDKHSFVERMDVIVRALMGRFTLVVEDGSRNVPVVELPLEEAIREVDILAIHKELLVESTTSFDSGTTTKHKRSADDFNLCRLVVVKITHIVLTESAAAREETAETGHLAEGYPRRRKSATALKSEVAIDVEHLDADSSHIIMGFSMAEAVSEGVFGNDGVGIEEKDVFALRLTNGKVVCTTKAYIAAAGNDVERGVRGSRETLTDVLDAMVRRIIVDDKDLGIKPAFTHRSPYAAEALTQVVFNVIRYDDD